jgi:DNA-damage-inducible protein J
MITKERRQMSMAITNYTLRIDEADKQKAESVFKTLGMTLSTGINVYLKTVGRQRRIPFALNANDAAFSLKDAVMALQNESAANGTAEMSMDEIDAEIAAARRARREI